jgi:hypothetical protein
MAKFKFELTAGFLIRSDVRNQLNRSKEALEYRFGGRVSIREEKSMLDSIFYVIGNDFQDTSEFISVIKEWELKIKSFCD